MTSMSLHTRHVKRYADIAKLLFKYGRTDLVKNAGLQSALEDGGEAQAIEEGEPANLANDLEALGPTFVKLGQLLSTRADLIPAPYLEALSRLQDDVDPVPFAEIEKIIEEELGVRISKAFQSFDPEPVASASLGQVHRAVLRDGRPVAVKVQRPNVREQVLDDLDALAEIAHFVDAHTDMGRRYAFSGMLLEMRESLTRELDYRLEGRHLTLIGDNLADFPLIVIPRPVNDFTTRLVLTMDFVQGKKITDITPLRRIELDGAILAEELFRAYLHQILVDGFFHADPHPGNVFLTDDDRVALIDLGMVARLSPRSRDQLLKLTVAIADGNGDEAAEVAFAMGEALPDFDREACRRAIAGLVAWNQGVTVEDIQVGKIVLALTQLCGQHGLRAPSELTMLGKTLLNLDRVGRTLDPTFDPNASIRRHAGEVAARRVRQAATPAAFLGTLVDTRELLRGLPAKAAKILEAVANNEVRVRVDAIDEDRLIAGMQNIANRITLGLVLAALIVGAALMMRVETSFRIFGYPGLAILLFLSAFAGGVWMAVHILASDGKDDIGRRKPTSRA